MLISVAFLDRPSLCSIQCNIFSLSSSPDRVSTNISCNGLLPLVYHSQPQRLAFLMLRLRTCADVINPGCRRRKPPLMQITLLAVAKNPSTVAKNPSSTVAKNPQHRPSQKTLNQPPVAKKPCYRRKKPEALPI